MLDNDPSLIGVVIPCYGHPQFLAEAIISACEQVCDYTIKIVVVDDGCRFRETGEIVWALMSTYPDKLYYLRQRNTRLPGARNAGIRFLLELGDDLDSIFFLDSDNRLSPHSLSVYRTALGDSPRVGWAYPDISIFGLEARPSGFDIRETASSFSRLKQLMGNISEAGSLVRADLFRSGTFFDESMTSGFEDWDFWLSALGEGFVGVRAQNTGFMYRRRPESMLADSRRHEEILIARIRTKHAQLYSPKNLLALEQREAPAFAIHVVGRDDVLLTSDPKMPPASEKITKYFQRVCRSIWDNRPDFLPSFLIMIEESDWEVFCEASIYQRWAFWTMRDKVKALSFVQHFIGDKFGLKGERVGGDADFFARMLVVERAVLVSAIGASFDAADGEILPNPKVIRQNLAGQRVGETESDTEKPRYSDYEHMQRLHSELTRLIKLHSAPLQYVSHQSKRYSGPSCAGIQEVLMEQVCAVEGRAPFPVNQQSRRGAFFVDPLMLSTEERSQSFSDLLRTFQNRGWETFVILAMEPTHSFETLKWGWEEFADDFVPVILTQENEENSVYLGHKFESKLTLTQKEDFIVLCRATDMLIAVGPAIGMEVLGAAKPDGACSVVFLGDKFLTDQNMASLHAKLLAYEHAIAEVICEDLDLNSLLAAKGFPPAKFQSTQSFLNQL
jgi:glycosyltransferase involved in cell wall biosynthesis